VRLTARRNGLRRSAQPHRWIASRPAGRTNVQEVLVQNVDEAIRETPEEEERRDKREAEVELELGELQTRWAVSRRSRCAVNSEIAHLRVVLGVQRISGRILSLCGRRRRHGCDLDGQRAMGSCGRGCWR